MRRFLLSAACVAALATPALAGPAETVSAWYEALLKVDRDAIGSMLAPGAMVKLEDLGVTQTRDEYIAALDEWEDAVAGATIRHRIEGTEGDVTTVLACYDFPENDILIRETFDIAGEQIAGNTQTTIADNCDGF